MYARQGFSPLVLTETGPSGDLLVFDPVVEEGPSGLADRFRTLDPTSRAADLIVVRGSTYTLVEQLADDVTFRTLTAGTAVVAVTPSSIGPEMVATTVYGDQRSDEAIVLGDVRKVELLALLQQRSAVFDGGASHHFVLPSGEHARQFIRLADALVHPIEVTRLADWILPFVDGPGTLLVDTGSILALAQVIQYEGLRRHGWEIRIDTLGEYPTEMSGVSDAVGRALDDSARRRIEPNLLLVVSVSSSGTVVRRFRSQAPAGARVLSVCDTNVRPDATTLLQYPIERIPVDESGTCTECPGSAIAIDPVTYERRADLEWLPKGIPPDLAEAHSDFWEAAFRAKAVRLHLDAVYPQEHGHRHFAVYVDIQAMLDEGWLRQRALDRLRTIDQPSVVIVSDHPCTAALIDLAIEAFPCLSGAEIHRSVDGRIPAAASEAIVNAASILLLDDVIVTGGTILKLKQNCYELLLAAGTSPNVSAFVVLARPVDDGPERSMSRRFRDFAGVNFHSAYRVLLPPGIECPWCDERRILERALERLDEEDRAVAIGRIRALEGELSQPPLFAGVQSPAIKDDILTRGSFFGDLDEHTGFAAAAAATQELKVSLRTSSNGSIVDVIDPSRAIESFFDDVLLAGILRIARRTQLRHATRDPSVAELLRRLPDNQPPSRLAELGWAASTGRLPSGPVLDLFDRCHPTSGPARLARALAALNAARD